MLGALDSDLLVDEALPDFNFNEIFIVSQRFGQTIYGPFDDRLALQCDEYQPTFNVRLFCQGVVSQGRELTDDKTAFEYYSFLDCEGSFMTKKSGLTK
jgi:hypothetical protein